MDDAQMFNETVTKREDGTDWEAKWFAYVPDPQKPSTWKLRLGELVNGRKMITVRQLGRAAAAFSPGGFRGNRVDIPKEDIPKVKARIRAEYKKLGAPIPKSVAECVILWNVPDNAVEHIIRVLEGEDEPSSSESSTGSSCEHEDHDDQDYDNTKAEDITMSTQSENIEINADDTVVQAENDSFANVKHDGMRVIKELNEQQIFVDKSEENLTLIKESDDDLFKIYGICGVFNQVNNNNRVYPLLVYFQNRKDIDRMVKQGRLLGQVDHPSFMEYPSIQRTCIQFTALEVRDQNGISVDDDGADIEGPCYVHFDAVIAPTSVGKDLITLIKSGFPVEWSSRGYGTAHIGDWKGKKNVSIIEDDYKLIAYDAVISAAFKGTFAKYEGSMSPDIQKTFDNNDTINKMEVKCMENDVKTTEESQTAQSVVPEDEILSKISSSVPQLVEDKIAEIEANKARVADKIEELLNSDGVDAKAQKILRKYISEGKTVAEVEELFAKYLPLVRDALETTSVERAEDKYSGIGVVHKDLDAAKAVILPDGDRAPRPRTIHDVIRYASRGIPVERFSHRVLTPSEENELNRSGSFAALGLEESPQNPRWVFERILYNWAFQVEPSGAVRLRPESRYLAVHTEDGYNNFMRNVGYFTEATLTSDFSAGNPQMLPIFRAVFPKLIASELVVVYPIATPTASIYLMEPQYDSGTNAGRDIADKEYFSTTFGSHTEGGEKSKLKLSMTSVTLTAVETAINVEWSEQSSQDLKAYFSLDMENELVNIASDYIAREINFKVLSDILNGTGLFNVNYGTTTPTNYSSPLEWRKELMTAVDVVAAKIAEARLEKPNWIVAGSLSVARLSSMPERWETENETSDNQFGIGLRRIGQFNAKYTVYECDWFDAIGGENKLLTGFVPRDWNNTGYLYCPYIPLYQTLIQVDTSTNMYSKALGSRYATRLHRPTCFGTVTIQPGQTTGDPLA